MNETPKLNDFIVPVEIMELAGEKISQGIPVILVEIRKPDLDALSDGIAINRRVSVLHGDLEETSILYIYPKGKEELIRSIRDGKVFTRETDIPNPYNSQERQEVFFVYIPEVSRRPA